VTNAYAKVKREHNPATADEMWAAWLAYVSDKRAMANGETEPTFA